MTVEEATASVLNLGFALDASWANLDLTNRIDTFSPLAGVALAPGSEVTILTSAPAGTPITGCP
jgi:hypothetical protein